MKTSWHQDEFLELITKADSIGNSKFLAVVTYEVCVCVQGEWKEKWGKE